MLILLIFWLLKVPVNLKQTKINIVPQKVQRNLKNLSLYITQFPIRPEGRLVTGIIDTFFKMSVFKLQYTTFMTQGQTYK